MKPLSIAIALAIIIIIVLTIVLIQQPFVGNAVFSMVSGIFDAPASQDPTTVQFSINQGETASSVADRLDRQRLVSGSWRFTLLARMRGVDSKLEPGIYALRRNMTPNQIIDVFMEGKENGVLQVTFPEGWRAAEMATLLSEKKLLSASEFLYLTKQGNFTYTFLADKPTSSGLEGYLFPDTYRVAPGSTTRELTEKMLQNFDRKFTNEMREKAKSMGLSINEVVTLASIIEREAVTPEERPLIAGIFLKRLSIEMPLQSCPTVQFAKASIEQGSAQPIDYWPQPIKISDTEIDSPYNTYIHKGLPPGPICNPGLASIEAVLNAIETDYLFFVAKPDGSHAFAKTYEEHLENVNKYGAAIP